MATATKNYEPINWRLVRASLMYRSWLGAVVVLMSMLYIRMTSEGIRLSFPGYLSMPFMRPFGYRIDGALICSLILMLGVGFLWLKILEMWLGVDGAFEEVGRNVGRHKFLIVVMGIVILGGDGWMFHAALMRYSWTDEEYTGSSLALTAAYVAAVVFVTYMALVLRERVRRLEKEN